MSTPDTQGPSVVYESDDSEPIHEEPHKELDSNISNDPNISTDAADQPGKEINNTTGVVTELKANRRLLEMGILQRAMTNASIRVFYYDTNNCSTTPTCSSEGIVQAILFCFMQGQGMYLDYDNVVVQQACSFVKLTGAGSRNADSDRSLFHKELTQHIFGLTGQKPRIAKEDDGRYVIHKK
jgi:hypothetical protein